MLLVIAGGYDARVPENVEHHHELEELVKSLDMQCSDGSDCDDAAAGGAQCKVVFRRSISGEERSQLLSSASG